MQYFYAAKILKEEYGIDFPNDTKEVDKEGLPR